MRPYFVANDFHLGDGGARDTFNNRPERLKQALAFLDYVQSQHGTLIILGDLFDFFQSNMSATLNFNRPLLDGLGKMDCEYIVGNHDIDLKYFASEVGIKLDHPIFGKLKRESAFDVFAAGKRIHLVHGHEQDCYCAGDEPGIGRITAIYTALKKDRNGGSFSHGATVESLTSARFSRFSRVLRRATFRPSYEVMQRRAMLDYFNTLPEPLTTSLVFGHTHEPGRFVRGAKTLPIYNSGSWVEDTPSFVRIGPMGTVEVFDWIDGHPQHNDTLLKV